MLQEFGAQSKGNRASKSTEAVLQREEEQQDTENEDLHSVFSTKIA